MRALLWRIHHNTSLALKLYLPVVLFAAVVFATIAGTTQRTISREITHQYEERVRGAAAFLDHKIATESRRDPAAVAAEHIEALTAAYPEFYRVTIYAWVGGGYLAVASSDPTRVGTKAGPHDVEPLLTGVARIIETTDEGRRILEVTYPLHRGGRPVATLGIYMSLRERDLKLAAFSRWILTIAGLTFVGILGVTYAVARAAVLGPLHRLLTAAEQVSAAAPFCTRANRIESVVPP